MQRESVNMTDTQTNESTPRKQLRLRPGVIIVIVQWLVRFGIPQPRDGRVSAFPRERLMGLVITAIVRIVNAPDDRPR